jgi:eukaryotic-like serine/threonine-protein kinase
MKRNKHSGKVLDGRYEILSLLDEGGMGAVYLGRHVKLGRRVAVKFLRGELKGIKGLVTRFYREARAASGISHPNIIDVYDVGVADWGEPYLVMEYLSGENLASLLARKGPISLAAACGIMEPTLRALHAAHERGIVHRDLKPENIFLMRQENGPPVIKIIDFGVSKFLQGEQTQLTRTGSLLGTPSYMSPEQARGRGTVDHRADIYSMGVVLYNMLSGSLPFVGESYNDLIVNILTEPAKTPTEAYPEFPADAEPIVMRLLEKDPGK